MNSYYLEIAEKLIHQHFESKPDNFPIPVFTFKATNPYDHDTLNEHKPFDVISFEKEKESKEENNNSEIIKEETFSPTEKILDSEYSKTYTPFSGCDMVISFDDKIYGEVISLDFFKTYPLMADSLFQFSEYIDRHLITKYPVVLVVKFTLFNKSIDIKDGSNITITYANEYGQKAMRSVFDIHPLFNLNGASVDSVVTEETFVLCAKDVTIMEDPKEGFISEDDTGFEGTPDKE